jgi:serine/threonine protein kinase
MMTMALRPKDKVDEWTLRAHLGRGGNGEVWRAEHPQHGEAALKILFRKSGDRYQRFSDEVEIMRRLGGRDGVLPLVAYSLPSSDSRDPAWLATPVAEPLREALGPDLDLGAIVEAVRDIASTLADLSTDGIYHRDLKPDNLFRLDGRWVLGDFGLVAYPEKDAVTVGDRRLGPLYFIAPEMLREPNLAAPGPADVYSLAKTLWVLVTGQRYPPEGQIRVEVNSHNLANWIDQPGALALGRILQSATHDPPEARPTMHEFVEELETWARRAPTQDDEAAEAIRRDYVTSLREQLAETVDPQAFQKIEAELGEALAVARQRSTEKQQRLVRDAWRQSEASRRSFIDDYGVKAALDLHDNPWEGSLRDGDDLAYAVMRLDPAERQNELQRARQILWGRPLWWMHCVGLTGSLKLRGQEGCEPLATDLAAQGVRDLLLEFGDHPTLAAAWRWQRAFVPATTRVVGYGPLKEMSQSMSAGMSAEDRLRYPPSPGRVMMLLVRNIVRTRIRQLNWTPQALTAAALEAEAALQRVPIPATAWDGPLHDPWLQSWSRFSPLVMCGLAILNASPVADDLLKADDLRQAIRAATGSDAEALRRPAISLAERIRADSAQ